MVDLPSCFLFREALCYITSQRGGLTEKDGWQEGAIQTSSVLGVSWPRERGVLLAMFALH